MDNQRGPGNNCWGGHLIFTEPLFHVSTPLEKRNKTRLLSFSAPRLVRERDACAQKAVAYMGLMHVFSLKDSPSSN